MSDAEKLFESLLAKHLQAVEARAREVWDWQCEERAQSEIEKLMFAALMFTRLDVCGGETSCYGGPVAGYGGHHHEVEIQWQHQIGPYRVDFALFPHSPVPGFDDFKIAIECDGHDFHERTKEQAKRDKSRDRYLIANGWKVLRFTGGEVYADAEKCAREAFDVLKQTYNRRQTPGAY